MTTDEKYEEALRDVNRLIDNGIEFPDACWQVSLPRRLSYIKLRDMYDAQFEGGLKDGI